jgi:general secretion pathway protein E
MHEVLIFGFMVVWTVLQIVMYVTSGTFTSDAPQRVYRPVGCTECRNTGYVGRIGIYEVLMLSSEVKNLITAETDIAKVRAQAYKEGMKPLRVSGALKIASGVTTFDEVMRVAPPAGADS